MSAPAHDGTPNDDVVSDVAHDSTGSACQLKDLTGDQEGENERENVGGQNNVIVILRVILWFLLRLFLDGFFNRGFTLQSV